MQGQIQQSATSQGIAPALPDRPPLKDSWVEKLFQTFEDWYGSKWAAQYGAFPRDRVKASWAAGLAGFAEIPGAISAALEVQEVDEWPPTMPKFKQLCRAAANRIGKPLPIALDHKLSPEEIERNKTRISELSARFARSKAMDVSDGSA